MENISFGIIQSLTGNIFFDLYMTNFALYGKFVKTSLYYEDKNQIS